MTRIIAALAPLALLASPLFAQEEAPPQEPTFDTQLVVIETSMGDITVSIETERAPITAATVSCGLTTSDFPKAGST